MVQVHHYLNVVTPGPFVIIRTPWPLPRWRDVLKALTPVMHAHGFKQKDIVAVEAMTHYGPDDAPEDMQPALAAKDAEFLARLDAAFAGDPDKLPKFWFYDWTDDEFVLVRRPTER